MRQRKVLSNTDEATSSKPVMRGMAAIDIFPKPKEDFQRQQTSAGAMVSAFTVGVIVLLLSWEFMGYAVGWTAYDTDLSIDKNPNRTMELNMDITFHAVSCNALSVDIRDTAGTRRINVTSIQKYPLKADGSPAFIGAIPDLDAFDSDDAEDCKLCFLKTDTAILGDRRDTDGELLTSKCCNSCSEVIAAYDAVGLPVPSRLAVPQCLSEFESADPGCRVVGTLHLKKIPGTLFFAPRQVKHNYMMGEVIRFNPSHTINKLVIGNTRVKRFSKQGVVSQLEGHVFQQKLMTEVRYYLHVVPTTYNVNRGLPIASVPTYEYSVQWRARTIFLGYDGRIPAVMFGFDFSPIQIDNYFVRPPFAQFLVKLCGIVGGLFVVLGVVDRIVARVAHYF